MTRRVLAALVLAFPLLVPAGTGAQSEFLTARFERFLDALRRQAGIPGLSAIIVQDGRPVWTAAFGLRDVEGNLPATPDTPYYVADLTQTVAATFVLKCIELGDLRPGDRVTVPNPEGAPETASVLDLLSHALPGTVEPTLRYSPQRFAALTSIVERCFDDSFPAVLARELIEPLGMSSTVPGQALAAIQSREPLLTLTDEQEVRYGAALDALARPYRVDRRGRAQLSQFPASTIDASMGLVSSVADLARFSTSLDSLQVLEEDTLAAAWSPVVPGTARGTAFGLGWFVQSYELRLPVVWHFGYAPDASSALLIKLPQRKLTFVMLANSDGLSGTYSLSAGDVTTSPFARIFLSIFG